jgi:uncharacterized protein (DUF952 family)
MSRRKILTPRPDRVYKICSEAEWRDALRRGTYEGSRDDLRDGFIHLSTGQQVLGVMQRYFQATPDLVLIALETAALGAGLRWEPSSGGEEYPHLYVSLPAALALEVKPLPEAGAAREAALKDMP